MNRRVLNVLNFGGTSPSWLWHFKKKSNIINASHIFCFNNSTAKLWRSEYFVSIFNWCSLKLWRRNQFKTCIKKVPSSEYEIQASSRVWHLTFQIRFALIVLGQSPWSMAMCLVWKSVLFGNGGNWSLFLLGDVQLIWEGAVFKINILAVKHLKINIMAWVPRKINTCK